MKQTKDGLFLGQTKFAKDLVTKFGLHEVKPANTMINTSDKITKDLNGVEVDSTYYQSIVGNLLYLIASRPNISFSVGACERYQASLKESHLKKTKRIICYVHGMMDFGFWYSFNATYEITRYLDADWVGNVEDCNSTSGNCFNIGNSLVS